MYPCEQDRTAAHYQPGKQAVPPGAVPPRRAKTKKHGASRPASLSSRRSSTTVVATDVNNFRAMVQELTGFPAAAIFRPLPRRVHAASPFTGGGGGAGQGCSGSERRGHGGSEATNKNSTAGGVGSSSPDAPDTMPAMAPPLGVFNGLTDLGSPEFDTSWGDLFIE
ncbi:uncharacterized protein C2845_PM11G25550 [Panicum miliaceum]|uniref:VQ domain-containing protein n=1 Tax=Panicum miliaceum TaxID=4540 RepID=A0A3L6RRR3_PANMI|nr:uncharacterized protein C2845_PM11G25550 [Panicum miliaceum]